MTSFAPGRHRGIVLVNNEAVIDNNAEQSEMEQH